MRWIAGAGLTVGLLVTAACGGSGDGVPGAAGPTSGTRAPVPADADGDTDLGTDTTTDLDDGTDAGSDTGPSTELFPDVVAATARDDGGTWTISATLSSPYDSPERYADGWRVLGPDGTVFAERELTHDHAAEQPFTRSRSGIEIPDDVDVVTIQGRDQVSGWGGETVELTLDR